MYPHFSPVARGGPHVDSTRKAPVVSLRNVGGLDPLMFSAVLGDQYCLPGPVTLVLPEHGADGMGVTDIHGNKAFIQDAKVYSMKGKRCLMDGGGQPVACMDKKLLRFQDTWHLYRGAHCKASSRVAVVKSASFEFDRTSCKYTLPVYLGTGQPVHCFGRLA